ncbi:MAG: type IX secretion system membrane protein PorP/SprF [Bacteroidia bacterium]
MKVLKPILAWCILLLRAQDALPYSVMSAPMALSPVFGGLSEANVYVRLSHNFRRLTDYATLSRTFIEAHKPIQIQNLEGGIGGFMSHQLGGGWRTTQLHIAVAYEAPLGVKARYTHVRAGLAVGAIQRAIEPTDLYYEDQFNGRDFSLPTSENFARTVQWNADYAIGLLWYRTQKIPGNVEFNPYAGFSAYHLNRPAVGFLYAAGERMTLRWNFLAGGKLRTRSPLEVDVALLHTRHNRSTAWVGHIAAQLILYEEGNWFTRSMGSLAAGFTVWGRDSYTLQAGFQTHQSLTVGFAYNVLSRKNVVFTPYGGLQLFLGYRLGEHKRPLRRGTHLPFPLF